MKTIISILFFSVFAISSSAQTCTNPPVPFINNVVQAPCPNQSNGVLEIGIGPAIPLIGDDFDLQLIYLGSPIPTTMHFELGYTVSFPTTHISVNGLEAGPYYLIAYGDTCGDTLSFNLLSQFALNLQITAPDTMCLGDTAQLGVVQFGATSVIWSPGGGLLDPTSFNPQFFPTTPGNYTITASTQIGACSGGSRTTTIFVEDCCSNVQTNINDSTFCDGDQISISYSGADYFHILLNGNEFFPGTTFPPNSSPLQFPLFTAQLNHLHIGINDITIIGVCGDSTDLDSVIHDYSIFIDDCDSSDCGEVNSLIISTGYDVNNPGNTLGIGSFDAMWTVVSAPAGSGGFTPNVGGPAYVITPHTGWNNASAWWDTEWINSYPSNSATGENHPTGTPYIYEREFCICGDTTIGDSALITYSTSMLADNWSELHLVFPDGSVVPINTSMGPVSTTTPTSHFTSIGTWSSVGTLQGPPGTYRLRLIHRNRHANSRTGVALHGTITSNAMLSDSSCNSNSTIVGNKYNDVDLSGTITTSDADVPNWTIQLIENGQIIATAQTDQQGYYFFSDVPPGTYTVSEVGQPGWTFIDPFSGSHTVTVGANEVVQLDFLNYNVGCPQNIGDVSFPDTICLGDSITLSVTASNNVTSYGIFNGNGMATKPGLSPGTGNYDRIISTTTPGDYALAPGLNEICWTFFDNLGCEDTICYDLYIDSLCCDAPEPYLDIPDTLCIGQPFTYSIGGAESVTLIVPIAGVNQPLFLPGFNMDGDPNTNYDPLTMVATIDVPGSQTPTVPGLYSISVITHSESDPDLGCKDTITEFVQWIDCDTIDPCDPDVTFSISDNVICEGDSFQITYGTEDYGQFIIYQPGLPPFVTDLAYLPGSPFYDFSSQTVTQTVALGTGALLGTYTVCYVSYVDTLDCSDTICLTFDYIDCDTVPPCQSDIVFQISDNTLCEGDSFQMTYGAQDYGQFIITQPGQPAIVTETSYLPGTPGFDPITLLVTQTVALPTGSPFGTYTICYVSGVDSLFDCSDTLCLSFVYDSCYTPSPCDSINLIADMDIAIINGNIHATDLSTADVPINFIEWSFDGGSTMFGTAGSSATWIDPTPGAHEVCLYTTVLLPENLCCKDTICDSVIIPPYDTCEIINFEADFKLVYDETAQEVYLSDRSSPTGDVLIWTLPDGSQVIGSAYDPIIMDITFDVSGFTEDTLLIFCLKSVLHVSDEICCVDTICYELFLDFDEPQECDSLGLEIIVVDTVILTDATFDFSTNPLLLTLPSIVAQWDFGDGGTSSALMPTYGYNCDDQSIVTRTVCLQIFYQQSDGNGGRLDCTDSVCIDLTFGPCLAGKPAAKIWPNPATEWVEVQLSQPENWSAYTLSDVFDSEALEQRSIEGDSFKIDLDNYSSGIYVIKLIDHQGNVGHTLRFIKQ